MFCINGKSGLCVLGLTDLLPVLLTTELKTVLGKTTYKLVLGSHKYFTITDLL